MFCGSSGQLVSLEGERVYLLLVDCGLAVPLGGHLTFHLHHSLFVDLDLASVVLNLDVQSIGLTFRVG